jgi:hypothetical protein
MLVFPMAGLSRRFAEAGFSEPKYKLPLWGATVFDHAVGGFRSLFETDPFLFIARGGQDVRAFIEQRCTVLGIRYVLIVMLDRETRGQAETVLLGLRVAGPPQDQAATVFNIDSFRAAFDFPNAEWWSRSDGYLEVFHGTGDNWSYVSPSVSGSEPLVAETAEKRPISDLCCTGLYHFAHWGDLAAALDSEISRPAVGELYVAPLYNYLIGRGRRIHYRVIPREAVTFCGVPSEYLDLMSEPLQNT